MKSIYEINMNQETGMMDTNHKKNIREDRILLMKLLVLSFMMIISFSILVATGHSQSQQSHCSSSLQHTEGDEDFCIPWFNVVKSPRSQYLHTYNFQTSSWMLTDCNTEGMGDKCVSSIYLYQNPRFTKSIVYDYNQRCNGTLNHNPVSYISAQCGEDIVYESYCERNILHYATCYAVLGCGHEDRAVDSGTHTYDCSASSSSTIDYDFGITPETPASCKNGGTSYYCSNGRCVYSPSYSHDLCLDRDQLIERFPEDIYGHPYSSYLFDSGNAFCQGDVVSCDLWCKNKYPKKVVNGRCETKTYPGVCYAGGDGCGFCNCTLISPEIPTLTIIKPYSGEQITNESFIPIDIRTTDDGYIKRVTLWISSAIEGTHCDTWPPWQMIKFDPENDTYTYDCYRDLGKENCINVFDPETGYFNRNLLEPWVCNGTPGYSCAVMGDVEDDTGQIFETYPWIFFNVSSCGNGICETEFETPENCPEDCQYTPINQSSTIFDIVKAKIKIWR